MSFILLIGLVGVLLVILYKRPIINIIGSDNKLVHKLENKKWFQNYWVAGIFLFVMNTFLFSSTLLVLYVLVYFLIPFVQMFVILLAVIGSTLLWLLVNKAWKGTKKSRIKMGFIGSSFYIFLTFVFVYWLVTMKPSYPGEDTFMGAIGLVFAIIVTTVAFITCFAITGFSRDETIN